jgi:hypothetical protein
VPPHRPQERGRHELRRHRRLHGSTHDAAREEVAYRGHVEPPFARPDAHEVCHLFLMGRSCGGPPIQRIRRNRVLGALPSVGRFGPPQGPGTQRGPAPHSPDAIAPTEVVAIGDLMAHSADAFAAQGDTGTVGGAPSGVQPVGVNDCIDSAHHRASAHCREARHTSIIICPHAGCCVATARRSGATASIDALATARRTVAIADQA